MPNRRSSPTPRRPWPLLGQLSDAVELLHALVIWATYAASGERPTFVEIGGIDLWGRCDDLTVERSAPAVLAEQLSLVRMLVTETVNNYGGDRRTLTEALAGRCPHGHLRPLIQRLFDELPA